MKKLLALFLTFTLLFSFAACTGEKQNNQVPTQDTGFVKPENYETVLTVTINPEFKLYLDAEGKVLAVEPVNDDAEEVIKEIDCENQNFKAVLKLIIVTSADKGFLKNNAVVSLKAVEKSGTDSEILSVASATVNEAANELKFTITVGVTQENDNKAEDNKPENNENTSSSQPGKPTTDKPTTDKPTTDNSSTNKPTTDKPSTSEPSAENEAEAAKNKLLEILKNSAYLAQYLTVYYDSGSAITPVQVMTYIFNDICVREELSWGDKVPAATFYKYAKYAFVVDDKMISELKSSKYYNADDDTYTLEGEYYSNSVHYAYVNSYDELGNDEYFLYIKYGAWDSNPDNAGFHDITCWKAKVKIREEIDGFDFSQILFYSIEKINSIPTTAISTNHEIGF